MHMVTYGSRDTDSAGWTLGLKPYCHIDRVSVQIRSVGYRIAKVDADAEAHSKVRWLIAVVDRNLLLDLHSTTHCAVDAIKDDQKRIAAGLYDPAAALLDGWINHLTTQMAEPLEGSCVIQTDQ